MHLYILLSRPYISFGKLRATDAMPEMRISGEENRLFLFIQLEYEITCSYTSSSRVLPKVAKKLIANSNAHIIYIIYTRFGQYIVVQLSTPCGFIECAHLINYRCEL